MSDCVMFVCLTFGSKIFACSQKYLVKFGVKEGELLLAAGWAGWWW